MSAPAVPVPGVPLVKRGPAPTLELAPIVELARRHARAATVAERTALAAELAQLECQQLADERARRTGRAQIVGAAAAVALGLVMAGKAAAGFNGFTTLQLLGQAVLWLVGAAAAVGAGQQLKVRVATMGGRKMEIWTHGGHGTRTAAEHEWGHWWVAKKLPSVRVTGARIFPDGSGITYCTTARNIPVEHDVALSVAGEVAAGTRAGCASDQSYKNAALQRLPVGERGRAERAGYALARSHLNTLFSNKSDTVRALLRNGEVGSP